MADLHEGFWDNLLDYIQDRTVIPVIGPELVTVRDGDRDVPLYRWIAQRLAADLELPIAELPAGFDLNDVVSAHLHRRGERVELYAQIHRMLRHAALTPPEPLRALAGIPGFDLFVSLTFDSLLADAIGAARGDARVDQLSYSPRAVRDLPCPKAELQHPAVFHLMGRASASPDYAICDEDLLELLDGMRDNRRQLKTLLDELHGHNLLIFGCSFGDWFWRYFLRLARGRELSGEYEHWIILTGDRIARDAKLSLLIESLSSDIRVIPSTTSARFVAELVSRWQTRASSSSGRSIPTGAIFVSSANEDLEAARRLAEGLLATGLEVWLKENAPQRGDAWARSIRRGRCSLFVPVISRHSVGEDNRHRDLWREWSAADDFARGMEPDEAFIIPVVIDDTRIDGLTLPGAFKKASSEVALDGEVTPRLARHFKELVREFHREFRRRQSRADAEFLRAIPAITTAPEGGPGRALPPVYSGSGDYIFISYKREDSERLSSILHRLVEWGHNIWYDKGIPGGAEWLSVITDHIKRCQIVVVFLSEAAVNSSYVRREILYASNIIKKPLIAVRLGGADLKHGLDMHFVENQMIDAEADGFLERLRSAIAHHAGKLRRHEG